MAIISLLLLVAIIAFASVKKVHIGVLGILGAFVLGFLLINDKGSAISSVAGGCKEILSAFPTTLVLRIISTGLLFGLLSLNGTLDIVTGKLVRLLRGNNKLLPWVFFAVTFIAGVFGTGGFGLLMVMMGLASTICKKEDLNFLPTGAMIFLALDMTTTSPYCMTGITLMATAESSGLIVGATPWIWFSIVSTLVALFDYFFLGGYKYKKSETLAKDEAVAKMNRNQIISLVVFVAFAVFALIGYEIGIIGFVAAALIWVLTKVEDEKKVFASIPWGVIVMIGGMNMMITMVNKCGGIDLLVNAFSHFVTPALYGPVFTIMGGLMSAVSSAVGVVIPTLVPAAISLGETIGASGLIGVTGVLFGAMASSISPFSSGGATVLAFGNFTEEQERQYFNKLVLVAVLHTVLFAVCSSLLSLVY